MNLAHAVDKTLSGKDLTDCKDMKGKLVIQELSAAAKKGGGFVNLYWPHPQIEVEHGKIVLSALAILRIPIKYFKI